MPVFAADAIQRSQPEVNSGSVLTMLWRRRNLIVLTTLAVIAAIAAYLFVVNPTYSATATLNILSYEGAAENIGDIGPARPQDEQRIATQIEQLSSRPLALAVVRKLNLVSDREFNRPHLPSLRRLLGLTPRISNADDDDIRAVKEAAITDLLMQQYVAINRAGLSHHVTVTARSIDPKKAVRIANTFVVLHLKRLHDEKDAATTSTITALEARVSELRRQATSDERATATYGRSRALIGSGGMAANPIAIDVLTSQLASARSGRAEAAARIQQNQTGGGSAPDSSGAATSALLTDLRTQQAGLDRRLAELLTQFGPGYPDVAAVRAQHNEIAKRIDEEQVRVRRELAANLAVAQARESQLSSAVGSARSEAISSRDAGIGFSDLQSGAQTTRSQYMTQLARLQELKGRYGRLTIDASVASWPVLPTVPSDPKPLRLLAVGLIGGLMLGCLGAIVLEQTNTRLYTGNQIERLLGVETLAMIPELTGKDASLLPQQLIAEQPASIFSESIRTTYLELTSGLSKRQSCIVVASPLPGEGKTRIAVSLAAVAVGMGQQPVVVELDLRRPSLVRVLGGHPHATGITEYLEGDATLDEIIQQDAYSPQLSFIGVTRLPADPGSLITPQLIQPLIDDLQKRFDVVIIDAPPILPVRDAQTLASLASATLMVVRWGWTRESAMTVARRLMRGTITGAVINRVDYRRHAAAAYGDQLQHYNAYASYFGVSQPPGRWAAFKAQLRRAI